MKALLRPSKEVTDKRDKDKIQQNVKCLHSSVTDKVQLEALLRNFIDDCRVAFLFALLKYRHSGSQLKKQTWPPRNFAWGALAYLVFGY